MPLGLISSICLLGNVFKGEFQRLYRITNSECVIYSNPTLKVTMEGTK